MASPETFQPASIDTFIYSPTATTNYGSETDLRVGESTSGTGWVGRTLIKFNGLSDGTIPTNAVVSSAVLSLYVFDDLSSNARTFRVYRQKRAWVVNQATWNIYSTGNNWATAGGFGSDDCEQTDIGSADFAASGEAGAFKDFSLTPSAIQAIINGAWTNNGFLIKADTESNDMWRFRSSDYVGADSTRPKLVVTYTIPVSSGTQVLII